VTTAGLAVPPRTEAVVDRENPWPGLDAYDESGKDYFKGRQEVINDLQRLVVREDLVLLYGISGLGKTSLLRAGLFPALPPHYLPVYVRLNYVAPGETSPARGPRLVSSADLVSQVVTAAQESARVRQVEPPSRPPRLDRGMWEYFRRADDGFWGPGGLLMTPILVFDQFEELFTRVEAPHAAQRYFDEFLHDLAHLVSGREPPWYESTCGSEENLDRPAYTRQAGVCKALLSFREDYLANVKGLSRIVPSIDRIFLRLEPMTRHAATTAVCEAGGHLMANGGPHATFRTSARIVRKVTRAPGRLAATDTVDPALLSLFCRELNEKRKTRPVAVIDRALVDSAEAARILTTFYGDAMKAVSAVTRKFVEDNLVLPGTRSRWPAAEQTALGAGVPPGDLEALARKRILRRDVSGGVPRLELTHDVLVDVVLDARAHRLDAEKLESERHALEQSQQRLTEEIARAERQRKRAVRFAVVAGLAVLLLLIAIVASIGLYRLEREQRARIWADAAYTEVGSDARLSTVLALRALEESARAHTSMPLAEVALNSAVRSPHLQARLPLGRTPWSVAVSAAGDYVALVPETRREVELLKAPAFKPGVPLKLSGDVFTIEFDGASQLYIVYNDTAVDRIDLQQPTPSAVRVAPPVSANRVVTAAAIRSDGKRMMVSSTAAVRNPYEIIDEPHWLSVFDEEAGGWQRPIIAQAQSAFVLSRNASAYAVLDKDGGLSLTPAEADRVQSKFGQRPVVELNADGTRLLVVYRDQQSMSLLLMQLAERSTQTTRLPSDSDVVSARFSGDGTKVAVVQADGLLSVWDGVSGKNLFQLANTQSCVFSEDSEQLLTWRGPYTLEIWDARTGHQRDRLGRHDDVVSRAMATRSGSIVTIAGQELYIWSRPDVDRLLRTTGQGAPMLASFSSDGQIVAAAADRAVYAYDVESEAVVDRFEVPAAATALAFAPTGRRLAVGTESGEVIIRTLGASSPEDPHVREGRGPISAVAFGTRPTQIAYAAQADPASSTVVLRDLAENGDLLRRPVQGTVVAIAIDAGSRVAVGVSEPRSYLAGTTKAGVSRARTLLQLVEAGSSPTLHVSPAAPPPSSSLPAPSKEKPPEPVLTDAPPPPTAGVVPAVTQMPARDATSACQTGSASFSRDWALGAAVTSCEQVVMRWRNVTGEPYPLKLDRPVSRVAVSPDATYLAVAFVDGGVSLYHSALPSRPVVMETAGPVVNALAFDPTNRRLLAIRSDGMLAFYPIRAGELQEKAQRLVGTQQPTPAECERMFGATAQCEEVSWWRLVTRRIWRAIRSE
jgi:WD40 repeat protein